jgi:hypothetical protein
MAQSTMTMIARRIQCWGIVDCKNGDFLEAGQRKSPAKRGRADRKYI